MIIVSAMWKPQVNFLTIQCDCGNRFLHRADRRNIKCGKCGKVESINSLREDFVNRIRGKNL